MKETTPAAMPPCFNQWCQRFDDIFGHIAQKREFRNYLGGLLGESERKNIQQMAANAVGVTYHKLHHFLTAAPWSAMELNQRRLEVMNQCRQTKINRGFSLIIDVKEYQVRDKRSLKRHLILVLCAYSFILWHTLTGGLRRRWANKPLNTFTEALEAFRTAISFRFVKWLNENWDVFSAYKASLGFIWA